MLDTQDTIAAISSAAGSSLRGIIRISGTRTAGCLGAIVDESWPAESQTPCRFETAIVHAHLGRIPAAIYYWPTQRSYTRQPSAEIHLIGAEPVLKAVLDSVCEQGARLAQPGEFTLRSFLAGRIDLTQAEAVLGVIDAQSDQQFQTALTQLSGNLASPIQNLRDDLIDILADVEAELDFVEDDIEFVSTDTIRRRLEAARNRLLELQQQIDRRSNISSIPRVVLIGPPNAGKSSLFNALAGQSNALVSDLEGTTRDYLTATLRIGSIEMELIDTAGFEGIENNSAVEMDRATREKSVAAGETADLILVCVDCSQKPAPDLIDPLMEGRPDSILVLTKSDLNEHPALADRLTEMLGADWRQQTVATSVETGNLDGLTARLEAWNADRLSSTPLASTLTRCSSSIDMSIEALEQAVAVCGDHRELLAADLRTALQGLGQVVGTVYTDDILDRIFGKFCIGK